MFSLFEAMFFAYLSLVSATSQQAPGELLSVFAEGEAQIESGNYLAAREVAMKRALNRAMWNVVTILIPTEQLENESDLINALINSSGMDFVQSYKFINENIDDENELYELDLQITLFMDFFRNALEGAGFSPQAGDRPKVVLIIDERALSIVPDSNFLLLPSSAEESVKESVTRLGYVVIDRASIRELKEDAKVLKAVNGEGEYVKWLVDQYDILYAILGRARSVAHPAAEGNPEWIEGKISATIYDGETGSVLWVDKVVERIEGDPGTGGFRAIRQAAEKFDRKVVEFIYNRATPK